MTNPWIITEDGDWVDLDDDDVDESAVAVYGKLGRAYERTTHFTKKPISRFPSAVRAARRETGL